MAAALRLAGVSAGDAAYLVATSHPESGGCDVIQQGQPYGTTGWGVWQITPGNSVPSAGVNNGLLNLKANAEAAAAKLRSQGLGAWTTITSGKYLPYFPAAKIAVANVYGMSTAQVNQLANSAGSGGSGGSSNAQTTALGGGALNPVNWPAELLGGVAQSLGVPNSKDLMVRLGLILLGGLLLIVGIFMLVGRQAVQVGIEAAAPESRAALATTQSTGRAREARTRARQARERAEQ